MLIVIIIIDIIGAFLSIWGSQTRGSWSRNISTLGGLMWFAGIIWGFIELGWLWGAVLLLVTFALANIFMRILPKKDAKST